MNRRLAAAAAILTCSLSQSALAADLYAGKTISIYVGSGAGGVYDVFGRLVARHMGNHIPGRPAITVQPMPGAGGIVASNYIYNVAAKDGTALGIVSPSLGVMEVSTGARYKAGNYQWIGRIVSTVNVTFTRGQGRVTSLAQAQGRESKIAVTGAGAALAIFTRAVAQAGGLKFTNINGYTDAAASLLAVERGEADGATVSWNSLKNMRPQWLADQSANILIQYALKSHSQLTATPLAVDLARNDDDRKLLNLFMSAADIGLALMSPPGTPAENVSVLRAAFTSMLDDPAFRKDAAMLEPDFDPLDGRALQDIVSGANIDSPALVERIKQIVNAE